jgi:hypothetical protein
LMIDALAECSMHSDDGQETELPVSPLKVNNFKRTYFDISYFWYY